MVAASILCAALTACGGGSASDPGADTGTGTGATAASASTTPTWTQCAGEGETCSFSGTRSVKYGVDASAVVDTFTNSVNCSNSTFGDPAVGQWKACWYDASTTVAAASTDTPSTPAAPSTTTPSSTAATNVSTSGVQTKANFSGTTTDFPNPDRGFYGWAGGDFVSGFDLGSVQAAYSAGQRLVLATVQIGSYRTSDFPASFLSTLSSRLAAVRSAGMKVTLMFSYDQTAGGQDASAAQIKRHLEQLQPVLAANADVIPFMRAGFIGAWGEWHSSQSGNSCGYNSGSTSCATADANRLIVRDALLANVPSTTQIGFRYPSDLIKWYPSATQQSRVGMHNDCYLSGPSDTGTYSDNSQRAYAQSLSSSTGFGGETCDGETSLRNSCADILNEGAQYHLAWLNLNYSTTFINAWKSGGCYAQVSRSMGYRIQLDALSHDNQVARGGSVAVAVDLRNVGWARMFTARQLVVTLKHKTSGALITGAAGDLRTLASQASGSTRVNVGVAIPSGAATGDYDVYVSAPDVFTSTAGNPNFAVRFANADSGTQAWDGSAARFKAGTTLTIN